MEVKENKIGKNEVKFVVWSIVLSFMMIVSSVLSMFMVDQTTFMSEIEKQIYAAELTYNEFNSSNKFVDGTNNNVSFEAYFVADRNNDGIAEKLDGAAVNSNANARLYIDLGINENGYIKDGVIEFSSNNNFNYGLKNYTSQFLNGVYNSDKINKINLKNIEAGTEFLLDKGLIGINLHNNINNYHFDNNSVKFKATYVPDVGPSVQIEKNINLTVDWYGTIETSVESSIDSSSFMRFVDGQNLENISRTVPVPIYVKTKGNLLLKDNIVRVKIGELNGYKAENVTVTSNNTNVIKEWKYDDQEIIIGRSNVVDENGDVTVNLGPSTIYNLDVTYPAEAFSNLGDNTVLQRSFATFDLYTEMSAYNNDNFTNPYVATANGKATLKITKTHSEAHSGSGISAEYGYVALVPTANDYMTMQPILNAYSKEEDQIQNYDYDVIWAQYRGNGELGANGKAGITLYEDYKRYDENSEEYTNMYASLGYNPNKLVGDTWDNQTFEDFVTNKSVNIFVSGIEKDGYVKLYDKDSNVCIKTLNVSDSATYNEMTKSCSFNYVFEGRVPHVKIETSPIDGGIRLNGQYGGFNYKGGMIEARFVKSINVKELIKHFSKDYLKNISNWRTSFRYVVNNFGELAADSVVKCEYEKSRSYISIRTNEVYNNSEVRTDLFNTNGDEVPLNIQIVTGYPENKTDYYTRWVNGSFLIEVPDEFVNLNINNVSISSDKAEILGYDKYRENGKYFIKIFVNNEEPVPYTININTKVLVNPTSPNTIDKFKLYAKNEYSNVYERPVADIFDVDSNDNTEEYVNYNDCRMEVVASSGFKTIADVSNFNNKDEIIIAPNVADVERGQLTAKVTGAILNNYDGNISNVFVLGKIPYKENSFIESNTELFSQFTAPMTNEGITLSDEIASDAVIYYSDVLDPTRDISDPANGWVTKENVTDFSNVRSYLIDLSNCNLSKGIEHKFNYNINIPQDTKLENTTFGIYSVYYDINTEAGNVAQKVSPRKIGIRAVKFFDLNINKYKIYSNVKVPGVSYLLSWHEKDYDNNDVTLTKILTTDNDGKISMIDLHTDREYSLREIKVPDEVALENNVINFMVNENGELTFTGNAKLYEFDKTAGALRIDFEDEVRYSLDFYKKDEQNYAVENAVFAVYDGNQMLTVASTNASGKVTLGTFKKYELGKVYTLKELRSEGYYFDSTKENSIDFKIERDGNALKITQLSPNEGFNLDGQGQIEEDGLKVYLKFDVINSKIPTYDLTVKKQNTNGNALPGAKFLLTDLETNQSVRVESNENGEILLSDLKQYVDGRNYSAEYTLTEIEAPEGYVLNSQPIRFRGVKDSNDILNIEILSNSSAVFEADGENGPNKLKVINKELFKIVKEDDKTRQRLAGVTFTIKTMDDNDNIGDYAKDINGNYVGTQDEQGRYILTTDSNGEIRVALADGTYIATEIAPLNGYEVTTKVFKIANQQEVSTNNNQSNFDIPENVVNATIAEANYEEVEASKENVIEISNANELMNFAAAVNGGNNYQNTLVKLTNNIDLTGYSYPSLTGFDPIGTEAAPFAGIFDGQNHTISNIYINSVKPGETTNTINVGLFGVINNAMIKDLTVSYAENCSLYANNFGGIVGLSNGTSTLKNCKITGSVVENSEDTAGGLIGKAVGTGEDKLKVIDCTNEATISIVDSKDTNTESIGGLIGASEVTTEILNGNNTSSIGIDDSTASAQNVGGLVGKASGSIVVIDSKNEGSVNGKYSGGMVALVDSGDKIWIQNSKNTGNISTIANNSFSNCGGMIANIKANNIDITIAKCENRGTVGTENRSSASAGIIGLISGSSNVSVKSIRIDKTSNYGSIYNNSEKAGIIGRNDSDYTLDSFIVTDTFNYGSLSGNNSSGLMGIVYKGKNFVLYNCGNEGLGCSNGLIKSITTNSSYEENTNTSVILNKCYNRANCTYAGFVDNIYGNTVNTDVKFIECYNDADIQGRSGFVSNISGSNTDLEFINCSNKGNISSSYSSTGAFAGQIDTKNVSIKNCVNTGIISGEGFTGGLIGFVGYNKDGNLSITDSINKGKVELIDNKRVGGLVGGSYKNIVINNSFNEGEITSVSGDNMGGLVGYADTNVQISNSANKGNLSATTLQSYNDGVGGLVGNIYSGILNIDNSYNSGEVFVNVRSGNVAGLVGYGYISHGEITNSYNSGNITGGGHVAGIIANSKDVSISKSFNEGTITCKNGNHLAGIDAYKSGGNITECYNTGKIIFDSTGTPYVGGIIGYKYNQVAVERCYNSGEINVKVANINQAYIGGISGNGGAYEFTVKDCYNSGNINTTGNFPYSGTYIGGIVGGDSKAYNCYNSGDIVTNAYMVSRISSNKMNTNDAIAENCYALDSALCTANQSEFSGESVSKDYLKSKELFNRLNVDNCWYYVDGGFPILLNSSVSSSEKEVVIENTKKEYDILTQIGYNSDRAPAGGSITGVNNEKYPPSSIFLKYVETVKAGENSTKDIEIQVGSGYQLYSLEINGEKIDFNEENGRFVLPAGYITNINENKIVKVVFERQAQLLKVNKVDANNSNLLLPGAKFKIETHDSSPDSNNFFQDTFVTDFSGVGNVAVKPGTYDVKEIVAPQGYEINPEIQTITITGAGGQTLTFADNRKPVVTVHHYLKNENGELTTDKLAEDEIITGSTGEKYTTSPKEFDDFNIAKDENGNYILPENAYGTFEGEIVVNYYYEAKPIVLTVHQYEEGTTNKLAEDVSIETPGKVDFNEDGTYNISTADNYVIAENEQYKDLSRRFTLRSLYSTVATPLSVEDTLNYNRDAELTYNYATKQHEITTEVENHIENRINPLTNKKENMKIAGGTITGEYDTKHLEKFGIKFVENVEDGKDGTKEIIVKPDENYRVKSIKIKSTNNKDDANQDPSALAEETTVKIFGEEAVTNPEVTVTTNADGSVKLSAFSDVTQNKNIVAEFEAIPGEVVVHYYMEGTGEEYNKPAVRIKNTNNSEIADIIKSDYVGEYYSTKQADNTLTSYRLVSVSGETSGKFTSDRIDVYYYYTQEAGYTVHYFYGEKESDNYVEDVSLMESSNATVGDVIDSYTDKNKPNHAFKKAVALDETGNEIALPLVIKENEAYNVINVYYKNTLKTVKVNYIDVKKNTLIDQVTKEGNIGENYTIDLKTIDGYDLAYKVDELGNRINYVTSRVFKVDEDEVNIYYIRKTSVKVSFIDALTGDKISEDKVIKGNEDDTYTTEPAEVEHYAVLETPSNASGKMTVTVDNNGNIDTETEVTYKYESTKTDVVVKHIDIIDNSILASETIDGYIGDDYTTSSKKIDKYTLVEKNEDETSALPVNARGKMKKEQIVVNYYYVANAKVIVKYLNIVNNNELAKSDTIQGKERKNYSTSPKTIEGFELVKTPENATGNMAKGTTEVIYYYKAESAKIADYTVHYFYDNVEDESAKETITAQVGSSIGTYINKVKTDYKLIKAVRIDDEGNEAELPLIIDADSNKNIINVYYKNTATRVIARYVDVVTGNKISKDIITKGTVGSNYTTEAIEIPSYKLAETPANAKGKMVEGETVVTYKYVADAKVTVKYVNKSNNEEIDKVTTINGSEGEDYTTEPKVIDGYVLDKTPANAKGKMTKSETIVTYTYRKKTRIIVKCVDENGKEIKKTITEGISGDDYKVEPEEIKGYTLVELPKDLTGKFTDQEKTIIIHYVTNVDVIVHYIDKETKEKLADDIIIKGKVGDEYNTKELQILGYKLYRIPKNASGKMRIEVVDDKETTEIVVTYEYEKVETVLPQTGINGPNFIVTAVLALIATLCALAGICVKDSIKSK